MVKRKEKKTIINFGNQGCGLGQATNVAELNRLIGFQSLPS